MGNGNNETPTLTVSQDGSTYRVHVVWQTKIDNYNYQIWYCYSSDNGSTWTAPSAPIFTVTVSSNQSYGPTAVITHLTGSSPRLLLVWVQSSGIEYTTSSDYANWSNPTSVPGAGSSTDWHPSLSSDPSAPSYAQLMYDDRYTAIYSVRYNSGNNTWSSVATTGTYNSDRFTNIALSPYNEMFGVWSWWNGSTWVVRWQYGYPSQNSWSSWTQDFSVTSPPLNSFYPSVTFDNNSQSGWAVALDWSAYAGSTYEAQIATYDDYYGGFYQNTLSNNAIFVGLSHDWPSVGSPQESWTDLSSVPYSIVNSANFLPKNVTPPKIWAVKSRSVEIVDTANQTALTIKLKGFPFKKHNVREKINLDLSNAFSYLQSEPISRNSSQTVEVSTKISKPDTGRDGKARTIGASHFKNVAVALDVFQNGTKMGSIDLASPSQLDGSVSSTPISFAQYGSSAIVLIPRATITGDFQKNDLRISIADGLEVFDSLAQPSTIAQTHVAMQGIAAYPNPFNPNTNIEFRIANAGFVSLKVFDILGREVATLVDGQMEAGYHTATFDASHLSSGLYFARLSATPAKGKPFVQTIKMLLTK